MLNYIEREWSVLLGRVTGGFTEKGTGSFDSIDMSICCFFFDWVLNIKLTLLPGISHFGHDVLSF